MALFAVTSLAHAQEAQTRIFTSKACPVTSPTVEKNGQKLFPIAAALLSAAIAPLVEAVVNKATVLVTDAAQAKNTVIESPIPIEKQFYSLGRAGDVRMNPDISCIVIVRGQFSAVKQNVAPSTTDPVLTKIMKAFGEDRGNGAIPADGDFLAAEPQFYFEASVVLGDDKKSIAFQPRALYVGTFASSNGLFGPSERSYKVALTFKDWATNQSFASTEFDFDGVKAGVGVQDCVDMPIGRGCNGERLGGLHGWFATKPATDSTQEEAKRRATTALMLANAIEAPQKNTPPSNPDDMQRTHTALIRYCDQQTTANKLRPDAQKLFDPDCPAGLAHAKAEYLEAKSSDQQVLDHTAAIKLWDKNCSGIQKTKDGVAECLSKNFYPVGEDALLSGDFEISSTIVEVRAGNKVAAFFAPTVTAVAPKAKDILVSELDPVARQQKAGQKAQADQAAAKASRQAVVAAHVAMLDVASAQASYDTALGKYTSRPNDDNKGVLEQAVIEAQTALLQKKSIANEAARTAGETPPYDDIY
ncbi:hypothetical protein [Paraburkholderia fungorum]